MKNKFKKLLSIVLSIAVVLSVCGILGVFTPSAQTQDTGSIRDYYVRYDGEEYSDTDEYGTNGTVDNPYKTVYDAVAAVNADSAFNVEGNTFNVWIMQDIAAPANMDADESVSGANYATHNMVSWAQANTLGTMLEHNAKMVVNAYENNHANNPTETATYLAFTTLAGSAVQMNILGPTEFNNVTLVMTSADYTSNANQEGRINCNGNNVKFASSVSYAYVSAKKAEATSWDGTLTPIKTILTDIVDIHESEEARVIENSFEVEFANFLNGQNGGAYIGFPSVKYDSNIRFKGDVTLTFSGTSSIGRLALGGKENNYASVIEKNLNFRFTGETDNFGFGNNSSLVVEGGVQAIRSSSFNNLYSTLSELNIYATEEKSAKAPIWFINVDKSVKDNIDFINGETGKFAVAKGYMAIATHETTGAIVESENGVLDLHTAAGEYTVTFEEHEEKVYDYYVEYGGTGDGTDINNPAPNVATAIAKMEKLGLTADETANIWIVQDIEAVARMDETTPYHNLASWGGTVNHSAKIIVKPLETNQSKNSALPTYLAMDPKVGQYTQLAIGGPTEFQNLGIVYCSNQYTGDVRWVISGNGHDLTIGTGVKYYFFPYQSSNVTNWQGEAPGNGKSVTDLKENEKPKNWEAILAGTAPGTAVGNLSTSVVNADGTYSNPITLTYNTDNIHYHAMVIDFAGNTGNATFEKDVNIHFNAPFYGPYIRVGTRQADKTIIYNQNLNVKIASETILRGKKGSSKVWVKGGVQLITNDKATFVWSDGEDYSFEEYIVGNCYKDEELTIAADYWKLTATEEDVKYINFIEGVIGKFTAVKEGYTAIAYNEDKSVLETADENGVINLEDKPGTYTVEFTEKIVHVENHDLDSYINYRGYNTAVTKNNGALANASKKLATEKELNVVYFGGSVTAGSGSTNNGSWRGRISDWLTKSFPTVKVNNYDQAIGETGTYLGCYRVVRDIVSKAPDILFIEYSINDFYDNASDARTSMQFETIVRNVKEAYPDCDIVTVLVTDVYVADEAANGILHPQAAVHEAISAKYNISTLHVGRYLATTLKDEGCTFSSSADAVWAKYFDDAEGDHDIVHPNNKGYDLYYQVVNAFMTNCLVFGDSSNYVVQNQVLPEMVNKYLFDGEVTYIDESDVTFTTEGGTTLSPDMQGIVYPDYQGLIRVPAGSQDVITVEFNGTELIMLSRSGHAEKAGNNYSVRIDGGEWVEYAYQGKNPIVIASGLVGGDHVAEIKVSPATDVFGNGTDYLISGFYSRNVEKATNRLSILDLVAIDETIDDTSLDYRDFNNDHVININDIATLKKILLNNR